MLRTLAVAGSILCALLAGTALGAARQAENPQVFACIGRDGSPQVIATTQPDCPPPDTLIAWDQEAVTDTEMLELESNLSSLNGSLSKLAAQVRASFRATRGAQTSDVDLQNALQKQQQAIQIMSNLLKAFHGTTQNVISNLK